MDLNKSSIIFLRLALAGSYLSAVADRFGIWGNAGEPGVVWGNMSAFLEYTQFLNPWASSSVSQALGYTATGLEILLSLLLIIGFKMRITSLVSFILLMIFGLTMTFTSGIKAAFDYSVFTAAAASLLLFCVNNSLAKKAN